MSAMTSRELALRVVRAPGTGGRKWLSSLFLVSIGVIVGIVINPTSPLQPHTLQAQGGCRTFQETGKTVCGRFLEYWSANGGLAQQGFPLSNEFVEISPLNGQAYTVQYFERAVFEKHPENAPPHDVLLSQLGNFQFRRNYPVGEPPPGSPPARAPHAFGEEIALAPGVTLLARSFELKRTTPSSSPNMFWNLNVKNSSGKDFPLTLTLSAIHVTDDAGNTYLIERSSGPTTPVAKANAAFASEIWIFTENQQMFDTIKYVDLTLDSLSGAQGPFIFRRYLQR